MKVTLQKEKLCVRNYDSLKGGEASFKRHGSLLPSSIRAHICGNSNSGKTSLMLSLINETNGLKFMNLYIFSKTLEQLKYKILTEVFKNLPIIGFYTFNNDKDVPKPENIKKNSIFIFDDLSKKDQNVSKLFFTFGRHYKCCSFILSQAYCNVLKHEIRDQCNLIIVFKQDMLNMKHIWQENVNTDMSFSKFVDICSECWKHKYGFIVIDKTREINNGRYRAGFHSFITI
jgi:hypothetical protein